MAELTVSNNRYVYLKLHIYEIKLVSAYISTQGRIQDLRKGGGTIIGTCAKILATPIKLINHASVIVVFLAASFQQKFLTSEQSLVCFRTN